MRGLLISYRGSYGFLSIPGDDKNVFIHQSSFVDCEPLVNREYNFETKIGDKGTYAVEATLIEE